MEKLQDPSSSSFLLGTFLNDPKLTMSGKYPINTMKRNKWNDFYDRWMIILYSVIYNLAIQGVSVADEVTISKFLEPYPTQKAVLDDVNIYEKIKTLKEISKVEGINLHYNIVRKYSLLRYYRGLGYDIKQFYDEGGIDVEEQEKLAKYEIKDIVDWFEGTNISAKKMFEQDESIEETQAGVGFEKTKEMIEEEPFYGYSTASEMLNTATRGLIRGQLVCFSSPTGAGKSTVAISNMAKICADEIYDEKEKRFIKNPCKVCKGGLIIQFELDNQLEVVPKFVASISKVSTSTILDAVYTKEENDRVVYANEVLKHSNIHVVYMPNYTITSINECIKDYVINHSIEFVVFDYLQECPALNSELVKNNGGVAMRTDQVLTALSSNLKDIARRYDINVYTMSQCNASLGTSETLDSGCIAGSRGVAHKFDVGGILLPLRPKEEKLIDTFIDKVGFNHVVPTHIFHMYKIRFSQHPQNVKIWVNVNLGTGEVKDCWATTWDNKPYKLKPMRLERSK